MARDCRKKDQDSPSEWKNKGKKPQSCVCSAKIEEVVDNCKSENEGPSTSKEESLPSYKKKDDIVAAIYRITAEQKKSTLEQLAVEGFQSVQCQWPGCKQSLTKRTKCIYCIKNLYYQYEDSFSIS